MLCSFFISFHPIHLKHSNLNILENFAYKWILVKYISSIDCYGMNQKMTISKMMSLTAFLRKRAVGVSNDQTQFIFCICKSTQLAGNKSSWGLGTNSPNWSITNKNLHIWKEHIKLCKLLKFQSIWINSDQYIVMWICLKLQGNVWFGCRTGIQPNIHFFAIFGSFEWL